MTKKLSSSESPRMLFMLQREDIGTANDTRNYGIPTSSVALRNFYSLPQRDRRNDQVNF